MAPPIVVDGSYGEGGGQVVRAAVALAALFQREIEVENIRAKRSSPGLRQQHLSAIRIVAGLCGGRVEGLEAGSARISFYPGIPKGGEYVVDVGTAGSVSLVLQAALPVCFAARFPTRLRVTGGTDVPMAPPVDYLRHVFLRAVHATGLDASITLLRRGHYPRGGGVVVASTSPAARVKALSLSRHPGVFPVRGLSHCVRLPLHIAERQARAAEQALSAAGFTDARVEAEAYEEGLDPHVGPGSGVVVWAEAAGCFLGGDSLGERGKPAEQVGREAAERLIAEARPGAALDSHMGDMVLPYLLMAEGPSDVEVSRVTGHLMTEAHVARLICGAEVEVIGAVGGPGRLRVKGLGLPR